MRMAISFLIQSYLITLKNNTVCVGNFTETEGEHWWNYNYNDVIAWIPLSAPYEAESKEI
jgi:hypothetical protein